MKSTRVDIFRHFWLYKMVAKILNHAIELGIIRLKVYEWIPIEFNVQATIMCLLLLSIELNWHETGNKVKCIIKTGVPRPKEITTIYRFYMRMWQRSTTYTAACTSHTQPFVVDLQNEKTQPNIYTYLLNLYIYIPTYTHTNSAWKFLHTFAWGNRKSVLIVTREPIRRHAHTQPSNSSKCSK